MIIYKHASLYAYRQQKALNSTMQAKALIHIIQTMINKSQTIHHFFWHIPHTRTAYTALRPRQICASCLLLPYIVTDFSPSLDHNGCLELCPQRNLKFTRRSGMEGTFLKLWIGLARPRFIKFNSTRILTFKYSGMKCTRMYSSSCKSPLFNKTKRISHGE